MIFKHPSLNDRRIIRKFCWFPITLSTGIGKNRRKETRWLMFVNILQSYEHKCFYNGYFWDDQEFIDKII